MQVLMVQMVVQVVLVALVLEVQEDYLVEQQHNRDKIQLTLQMVVAEEEAVQEELVVLEIMDSLL